MNTKYFGVAQIAVIILLIGAGLFVAWNTPDEQAVYLYELAQGAGVQPLSAAPDFDDDLVILGEALFFDKELSGNRDIACATCHHPQHSSGDALALSLGTGNTGLGPQRIRNENRELIPRHAPDVFNLGLREVIFWDGRVQWRNGLLTTPAGNNTPDGLMNVAAAQALFPITSRDEMRGAPDDTDIHGNLNELAQLANGDFVAIWDAVLARLLAIESYRDLLRAAYPDVSQDELTIAHIANALGAYQVESFTFIDSPWNRFVRGDHRALTEQERAGALLFFGDAGCAACHNGPTLSDGQFYNIGIPQLGPGKNGRPHDYGRWFQTGQAQDMFAFRTPSLLNIALTAPYTHSGAYGTLADVIRHKQDPVEALLNYTGQDLHPDLRATWDVDSPVMRAVEAGIHPAAAVPVRLREDDITSLVAFLAALTDPAATQLEHITPQQVPSGLPVADV